MKRVIFIPEPIGSQGLEVLAPHCECLTPWKDHAPAIDSDNLLAAAEGVIVRTFRMTAERMDAAPRLRVIAKHGVGFDNIDIAAATERGIPVLFTPGTNANAVAEHAIGLLLMLSRQIGPAEAAVRDGWRVERSRFEGIELACRTLGIIGLGRIGKRLALKASLGLGMQVLAYDPYVDRADYPGPARLCDSFEELMQAVDIVSLHVPLTDETSKMINADSLALLKPGCLLINTARGAVVDELALAAALQSGHLAGAALDVFETEPLPADDRLLSVPNLVLTPHIAGQTDVAMQAAARMAAQGVLDALHGHKPQALVNPEVFDPSDEDNKQVTIDSAPSR